MINEDLIKLEKAFYSKLHSIQKDFDTKIMELKSEFVNNVNSILLQNDIKTIVNNNQIVLLDFNYILTDDTNIERLKSKYKKSTRHYYCSYNILVDKYLIAFKNDKKKAIVKCFAQILAYYPDELNKFLSIHKNSLFDGYEKVLFKYGFTNQK